MRLIISLILCGVAGCGTMANLEGKRYAFISMGGQKPVRVYGGVRNDIDWISEGVGFPESERSQRDDTVSRQPVSIIEDPVGVAFGIPMFGYFAVVDPVLSFVGDTVTLPYVMKVIRDAQRDRTTAEAVGRTRRSAVPAGFLSVARSE